jgi:hypothetical protein
MTVPEAVHYTEAELKSFLPGGWELAGGGAAEWDDRRQALTLWVVDNVKFDWPVVVRARDAARHGRLEALRRAIDEVYRDRLGRPTRGLGLAR